MHTNSYFSFENPKGWRKTLLNLESLLVLFGDKVFSGVPLYYQIFQDNICILERQNRKAHEPILEPKRFILCLVHSLTVIRHFIANDRNLNQSPIFVVQIVLIKIVQFLINSRFIFVFSYLF